MYVLKGEGRPSARSALYEPRKKRENGAIQKAGQRDQSLRLTGAILMGGGGNGTLFLKSAGEGRSLVRSTLRRGF